MRLGLTTSILVHATVLAVAFVVLAHPPLLDATTQAVIVELVPAKDVDRAEQDQPANQRDALTQPTRPETAQKPQPVAERNAGGAGQTQPSAQAQTDTPSRPSQQPARSQPAAQASQPAAQQPAVQSPEPDQFTAPAFNPFSLSMTLPGAADFGFDSPADAKAKLTPDEIAEFQAHLQKCWHPLPGLASAQKLKVLLRIALSPDGSLAHDPIAIGGSASVQGPRLAETATRALQACQPFSFLPADKYPEWKVLDLSFSPRGLGG